MTYSASGLKLVMPGSPVGDPPGNVKNVYHYSTNDTLATVAGSEYFNSEAAKLKVGDIIIVSGDIDGTPAIIAYVVATNDGSTVTVTGFATVTQTYNARYALNTTIALTDGDSGYVVAPFAGTITAIYTVL